MGQARDRRAKRSGSRRGTFADLVVLQTLNWQQAFPWHEPRRRRRRGRAAAWDRAQMIATQLLPMVLFWRGLDPRSGIENLDRTHEPYARLYISAQQHPKFQQVGALGWAFFWACVNYSRRNLTDGFVPMHQFLTFFDDVAPAEAKKVAARLVKARLLHPRKGGLSIHDWSDHQNTKAEVEAASRVGRENVVRGRWSKQKNTTGNRNGIASDTKPITHSLSLSRSPSLSVTSDTQQRGANRSVQDAAKTWAEEREDLEEKDQKSRAGSR